MDLRKLKTLIDLVAESDIAELEVTEGESKVRIVKSGAAPQNQVVMMPQGMQPQYSQAPAAAPLAAAPAVAAPAEVSGHVVKSPMVGSFYRSSAPGAPSFWPPQLFRRSPSRYADPGPSGPRPPTGPSKIHSVLSAGEFPYSKPHSSLQNPLLSDKKFQDYFQENKDECPMHS